MKCRKRRVSARQLEKKQLAKPKHEKGVFAPLPNEVSFFLILLQHRSTCYKRMISIIT